jgi:hypothetical protein
LSEDKKFARQIIEDNNQDIGDNLGDHIIKEQDFYENYHADKIQAIGHNSGQKKRLSSL